MIPLRDKTNKIQVTIIRLATSMIPQDVFFGVLVLDCSISPLLRNAVMTGRYSRKANPAFRPAFSKLNGRKTGSNRFY